MPDRDLKSVVVATLFVCGVDTFSPLERFGHLEELRRLTLECFWKLPDREINQWLRHLIGKRKFVIVGGHIVDMIQPPLKPQTRPYWRIKGK